MSLGVITKLLNGKVPFSLTVHPRKLDRMIGKVYVSQCILGYPANEKLCCFAVTH